jgi:glutaconate CoA-transferase subunit A
VPFIPTRVGLGSELLRLNPNMSTIDDPYGSGTYVAAPALELDAAICHLNISDERGNAAFLGPDLYFDDLFLRAAPKGKRFLSVERTVPTGDLVSVAGTELRLKVSRLMVDGLVVRPGAAHFTSCVPDYERDEAFQKEYAASAKSPEAWAAFCAAWLDITEDEYQAKVASR